MKLSIIIPLYNTAKYIEQCVLSALKQDIATQQYEILIVDDGSTDSSPAIAASLAGLYKNVKVLTKPNGGLSDARNHGTKHACGDYILFLDADDYLMPNVLATIVGNMQSETLDMLSVGYKAVDENGNEVTHKLIVAQPSQATCGREYILHEQYQVMAWTYCYRREFLVTHALSFMKIWHEDEEFTPRAITMCHSIRHIDLCVYCYRQHAESFTKTYKPQNLIDLMYVAKSLLNFANTTVADDPLLQQYFKQRSADIVVTAIKRSVKEKMNVETELIYIGRKLGTIPVYNLHHSAKIGMLNTCPRLYIAYYKLHKHK